MKNISDYLIDRSTSNIANTNEMIGVGLAIGFLALGFVGGLSQGDKGKGSDGGFLSGLFGRLFGPKKTPEERRKEEEARKKHELEMKRLQKELDDLDADSGISANKKRLELQKQLDAEKEYYNKRNKKSNNNSAGGAEPGEITTDAALALAEKSAKDIKDPVLKAQFEHQSQILRCASMTADGKPRTLEEMSAWMKENVPAEEMEAFDKLCKDQLSNVDINGKVKDEFSDVVKGLSEDEIKSARENAAKQVAELGPKMEADAKTRKEMAAKIETLKSEKDSKQKELDDAISEAEATDDEAKIKEAKLTKAEFNKKSDLDINATEQSLNDFESNCESGKFFAVSNPARVDRLAKQKEDLEKAKQEVIEKADKEIKDLGGDPTKTTPQGSPEERAKAEQAVEDAKSKKEAAYKEVADAQKALEDNKDDSKTEELTKTLKEKQDSAKKADDELKQAQTALSNVEPKKNSESEPKKNEESKGEKIPVDPEDPNGDYVIKKEDGSIKMVDTKTGEEADASQEDFDNAKKAKEDFDDDVKNSQNVDHDKDDDETTGDADAEDGDADAEDVNDGKGGKKKVIKNPAQTWHRKKRKNGGSTKSYYNSKGKSISASEFHEKMNKYKERLSKTQNSSLRVFMKYRPVNESARDKYNTLRQRILNKIVD